MKQTCPECKSIIEIDEKKYKPGEKLEINCPLCETTVIFSIPRQEIPQPETVEKIVVKEVASTEDKKKIADLEAKVERLSQAKVQSSATIHTGGSTSYVNSSSSGGKGLVGIIVLLLVVAGAVGGYFYYQNVYLPEKIDREAPRYYTLANSVVLRSSKTSGADFNKVGSLPYGTELITYEHDDEWSKIKVNVSSASGEKLQGYVASPFILNKCDFFLMNSIFGDTDSKETVLTTKCRIALLNYFKEKQYIGDISADMRVEAGIAIMPNDDNQWQVFSRPANTKPNSVFFKRLINRSSKFTDFAVIIKNIKTGNRKLLFFYFDDDETPHFATEQMAPITGFIKDMYIYSNQGNNYLHVDYSE